MDFKFVVIIIYDIKNFLGVLEGELCCLFDDVLCVQQVYVICLVLQEKLIVFLIFYKVDFQGLCVQVEVVLLLDFFDVLVCEYGVFCSSDIILWVDEIDMLVIGFFDEYLVVLVLEVVLQNVSCFVCLQIVLGCCKYLEGGVIFMVCDDGFGIGIQEKKLFIGLGMDLCNVIVIVYNKEIWYGEVCLFNYFDGGVLFELCLL